MMGTLFSQKESAADRQKMTVGMVGDLSDSYMGIGVFAVQNYDTSKDYITLEAMKESEAKTALKKGEIGGYLLFPDDFIESVMRGENRKLTFVTDESPAVLNRLVTKEVVGIVSDMILQSQNGIYGYIDYVDEAEQLKADRKALIERINIEYITRVFDRESLYDLQELGFGNRLSFEDYYTAAFLVLMILLWGTVCGGWLIKTDLSVDRSLLFRGYTIGGQVVAEYIPFVMVLCLNTMLVVLAVGGMMTAADIDAPVLAGFDEIGEFVTLGLRLLPAVMLLSAMQFFFYTLTSHIISGVLLQVLSVVALSYLSGLLYPLSGLPTVWQQIASFLPTGVAFSYVGECVTRSFDGGHMALLLGYAALLLFGSFAVRRRKIRGGRI